MNSYVVCVDENFSENDIVCTMLLLRRWWGGGIFAFINTWLCLCELALKAHVNLQSELLAQVQRCYDVSTASIWDISIKHRHCEGNMCLKAKESCFKDTGKPDIVKLKQLYST